MKQPLITFLRISSTDNYRRIIIRFGCMIEFENNLVGDDIALNGDHPTTYIPTTASRSKLRTFSPLFTIFPESIALTVKARK